MVARIEIVSAKQSSDENFTVNIFVLLFPQSSQRRLRKLLPSHTITAR